MNSSQQMQLYFQSIQNAVNTEYGIAKNARIKGFDPTKIVDIKLAKNLAERVVGLISVVCPQINESGVVERILELENKFGSQDWRVAMQIALEIAQNKFVQFAKPLEAIEVGIRVGFAYVTVGVVSSPLEGFTKIELKKRFNTKEEYFAMFFAGPVRNAGGTAAATSVIIADYVRKHLGYAKYDPTQQEQERCYTEIMDYHERVTNLQYVPSKEESIFMCKNCPIEIDGDPSEKFEVSNFKDLSRIKANRLRSGFCLIHSSCLPLKAKKLWKQISKWKDDMGMQDWGFLKEFLDIQKKATSKSSTSNIEEKKEQTLEEKNVYPNYTYIADLVGGRPVISHPLKSGGLRLRYGRGRTSGFSAQSIHPATMFIMDNFIAIATQLKVERPGKATAFTTCDNIEGPIVLLHDGSVVRVQTIAQAKELHPQVKQILYLGDVLINYGDFYDRAHTLLRPGYCEEWWILEVEKKAKELFGENFYETLSQKIQIPLSSLQKLFSNPLTTKVSPKTALEISQKICVSLHPAHTYFWKLLTVTEFTIFLKHISRYTVQNEKLVGKYNDEFKKILEKLGICHIVSAKEFIIIQKNETEILVELFQLQDLNNIQKIITRYDNTNPFEFIQTLGYSIRDKAGVFIGSRMGRPEKAKMRKIAGQPYHVPPQQIKLFDPKDPKNVQTEIITEHNLKAKLREKYEIHANKDGTIRYDASEVPITHFKPKEIQTSIQRLKELGYSKDIHGKPIEHDDQIIEIYPQDIVIPCCTESPFEPAHEVLYRVANYIDDLLMQLYGLEPYYNLKHKEDLAGLHVFGLAPHTSAASVARIIGFTKSQGMFCHPIMHAAMRRDCFAYDTIIPIKKKGVWKNVKIGELVENLNPQKIVDSFQTTECKPKGFTTIGLLEDGSIGEVPVINFTKHEPQKMITIKTKLGRSLQTTLNHKHITNRGTIYAKNLQKGDKINIPYVQTIKSKDVIFLDLLELYKNEDWVMVRGLQEQCNILQELKKITKNYANYSNRDSIPITLARKICSSNNIDKRKLFLSAKRDHVKIPAIINVSDDFLTICGLYIAEGYSRKTQGKHNLYQTYISSDDLMLRKFIKKYFLTLNLKPSENKDDRVTFSSRIIYDLFTNKLEMGSNAYTKRIPSLFLSLPPTRIGKLLGGYFEGDGSVSKTELRLTFDTVSKTLLQDIQFILAQQEIFIKYKKYTSKPGKIVSQFYERKKEPMPSFTLYKGIIQSKFIKNLQKTVSFISKRKKDIFSFITKSIKYKYTQLEYDYQYIHDEIISIEESAEESSYCLHVPNSIVIANGILTRQCDGDESCFFLLMDGFLNFSTKFLPQHRGGTMDAPLVLTSIINPAEVDDMVFNLDIAWKYPLEFYEACEQYKKPWDVKIPLFNDVLGTEKQFEGMGFTHDTTNFNDGVLCSAYKILPSMKEKVEGQMALAEKIAAVDEHDVAQIVINKHFLRDTMGNLRKFSTQEFRCVACNTKYRRPPLRGRCETCGSPKIIFTISKGSVIKYLELSTKLSKKYNVSEYTRQVLEVLQLRVDGVFGKEKEKQTGLGDYFG